MIRSDIGRMDKNRPGRRPNHKDKLWFNWPLALGLVLNFIVLALIGSCIVRNLR